MKFTEIDRINRRNDNYYIISTVFGDTEMYLCQSSPQKYKWSLYCLASRFPSIEAAKDTLKSIIKLNKAYINCHMNCNVLSNQVKFEKLTKKLGFWCTPMDFFNESSAKLSNYSILHVIDLVEDVKF